MGKNINIKIPEELHKAMKLEGVEQNKTLKELLIEILRS